jgi:anthranilate phosphoribosyltransferase
VLAALGVNINAETPVAEKCLREAGVCFCFAIRCHPAMKYAAPVRKALGVRTLFNILGPLTNPACARRQLMGVFDPNLTETIASVLGALGSIRATVVHAEDGLDEISTASDTKVSEWRQGKVTTRMVKPEDFGLRRARIDDLLVKDAQDSANVIRKVLSGAPGPQRDIVLLNAAAALAVAGEKSLEECLQAARESIDTGAALRALERLVAVSNQPA